MNLQVEPGDPSSALTGLEVILYPRRADLTADNADYQAAMEEYVGHGINAYIKVLLHTKAT